MKTSAELRGIRKKRQRYKISRTSCGRCRLLIHRTNNNMYAQILDISGKNTVVHVSTLSKAVREEVKNGGNKEAAVCVGRLVAVAALGKGIKEVVFDRSGFLYHGRVQRLAESARENGLVF
ncbi:MAG: 50S ribosomal protein L18 [Holosporales bacterium]|jgi:large subunit ribosomal protein L18|nr:50S ribosomal protein L18 [Holosporales bacterium]